MAEYIVADIGSKKGCEALVEELKKRTDSLQIVRQTLRPEDGKLTPLIIEQLINNSGTTWGSPFEDVPEVQGWDRVLGTSA